MRALRLMQSAAVALTASIVTLGVVALGPAQDAGADATTLTTSSHQTTSHAVSRHTVVHLVDPVTMAKWSKVAICEEGGNWKIVGPRFSGGLGISNVNWDHYGGRQFAANAGLATPEQQVVIAMRIQRNPPDQFGCAAW